VTSPSLSIQLAQTIVNLVFVVPVFGLILHMPFVGEKLTKNIIDEEAINISPAYVVKLTFSSTFQYG